MESYGGTTTLEELQFSSKVNPIIQSQAEFVMKVYFEEDEEFLEELEES